MSALWDWVQQLLIHRALAAWPEMPRASQYRDHAPVAEWQHRLDVVEARLEERSRKRLDAEAAQIQDHPHA